MYGLDWTAKSKTNLRYNPLSPAYGVLSYLIWDFLEIFLNFTAFYKC